MSKFYLNNQEYNTTNLRLGDVKVSKLYKGSLLVWGKEKNNQVIIPINNENVLDYFVTGDTKISSFEIKYKE